MLPGATEKRTIRERKNLRISGRNQEIQRLIGRSLRAVTDLEALKERTIIIDCDVIQADGGTRTASISGSCIALAIALKKLLDNKMVDVMPLKHLVSAVSAGTKDGNILLDLDYNEDSQADVDINVVETDKGRLVEVQATGEENSFSRRELDSMLKVAHKGIKEIQNIQKDVLKKKSILFMAYR
jgi:ribonuclease PH